MEKTLTAQISQRGVLTLPKALRDSYKLKPGDVVTVIDLGGAFVISPRRSEVDRLADEIGSALAERGESLESMLAALREEREKYGPKA
ncbi:MAG: AbrB/MazE/SpoVT family DNA-binding domain-containing protein [Chloroflexi bacterium]|nr:MAG: AbrB/MazE/SpoVT family DNA-binding domain-containing protein [Chloroflexota bacterium]RPH63535.1 MAG: AbrB/MazE/SpoVT family DNA-binding domain-containing protein [Chloroflexota bacterium]